MEQLELSLKTKTRVSKEQKLRFIFKLELSASIFRQKNSVSFFKTHRDELPFSGTSPRPNSNHFPGVKLHQHSQTK